MRKEKNIEIEVVPRMAGKHHSRTLRKERRIPAVVYGPKTKNMIFSIHENDVVKYSRGEYENSIFTLISSEPQLNKMKVLKKNIDRHPIHHRPVHLDFYAMDMTQTIMVNVKLDYIGKAQGVKDGGVFNAIRRDLEIECLPTEIPESFEVDISEMKINDVLHVSDIKVAESIKVITSDELTIASVAQVAEEPEAPAAQEAEAAPATEGGEPKAAEGDDDKKEDKK